MKNSTVVYTLWALSFVIAILSFFKIGKTFIFINIIWKITLFLPFIALYFADKVKKLEDQNLGKRLVIFTIIIFVILIAIQSLPFFLLFGF